MTDQRATAAPDGFCTCDGDPRIDVTCGIYRHRARARAQMNPPPPPNPLLGATVDDEPAVPLVGNPTATAAGTLGALRELTADLPDDTRIVVVMRKALDPDHFYAEVDVESEQVDLTRHLVVVLTVGEPEDADGFDS